jgi:hypothetical protein
VGSASPKTMPEPNPGGFWGYYERLCRSYFTIASG